MTQLLPRLSLATLVMASMMTFNAYADTTQVGRYLTVENKPQAAQLDLLSQEFQVRFPASVQTIGDAMTYLLKQSGYRLVPEAKRSTALKITLSKPLPAIDRDFGPMKLKDGLMTLAGPIFTLVNDPLNRTVNFSLRKEYTAFGSPAKHDAT